MLASFSTAVGDTVRNPARHQHQQLHRLHRLLLQQHQRRAWGDVNRRLGRVRLHRLARRRSEKEE